MTSLALRHEGDQGLPGIIHRKMMRRTRRGLPCKQRIDKVYLR